MGCGRAVAPDSKVARMVGTCSYLLGSGRWKKVSWPQEASGTLYFPNQRSRHQVLGFCFEWLDPVTEHLLHARPLALLGRMGVWEDSGCCPQVAQPYGECKTNRKFADTGFPYQSRTNNSGNAKRLRMINCQISDVGCHCWGGGCYSQAIICICLNLFKMF